MRRKLRERIQGDGVVKEVQRCHQKDLWKRRKGQTSKGSKGDEGEEEKNWMVFGEHKEMVLPPLDDRPKSGGSECGVGKCTYTTEDK